MPPSSIEDLFGGSKPPPYEGGSICKELSRPIYILDVLWYNFLGSYLLDKLEFVEMIATASCLSTPATRDII